MDQTEKQTGNVWSYWPSLTPVNLAKVIATWST